MRKYQLYGVEQPVLQKMLEEAEIMENVANIILTPEMRWGGHTHDEWLLNKVKHFQEEILKPAKSNKFLALNSLSSVMDGMYFIILFKPAPCTPLILSDLSPSSILYVRRFFDGIPYSSLTLSGVYNIFFVGLQTDIL